MRSLIRRLFPTCDTGDAAYALYRYMCLHRRLPRKNSRLVNDQLFRMKVDGTLLDPLRQFVTDKEYVKIYIAAMIGDRYNVKTFDILRQISNINAYKPVRFPCVVKPSHSSGQVRISLSLADFPKVDILERWLSTSLYKKTREQNYKFLTPKIIVEEFISHDGMTIPEDYKIHCFHGIPKFIQVDSDRFTNHTRNFYDSRWNPLDVEWNYPNRREIDPRPDGLDEMLEIAATLAAPFEFIRVDFYAIGPNVKVGELTNCPENAGGMFKTRDMERRLYHW